MKKNELLSEVSLLKANNLAFEIGKRVQKSRYFKITLFRFIGTYI